MEQAAVLAAAATSGGGGGQRGPAFQSCNCAERPSGRSCSLASERLQRQQPC